ncbi:hypothetical protein AA957_09100 [Pseudomonas trivialis]|uniref:Uncharacterized protein n=1 Tax=Pseudomonas trivialis TaxID=200450 RepID=A0A0H5APT8_9PSED|nr:hypothetical protein AA957_09100 [Pseudomonas trivialis]
MFLLESIWVRATKVCRFTLVFVSVRIDLLGPCGSWLACDGDVGFTIAIAGKPGSHRDWGQFEK